MLKRLSFPVGPLACNCSILGDVATRLAFVFDPGDEAPKILSALAKEEWSVVQILHTHAHLDHIGATATIAAATLAPVRWHPDDQFLVDNLELQAQFMSIPCPPKPHLTKPLCDGEHISLAGHLFEVHHVPGHSPGSVMFVCREAKLCIAGDMIFANGQLGRADLPGGSQTELLRSLEKRVLSLPDDCVLVPGHGPETTIGAERVFHER